MLLRRDAALAQLLWDSQRRPAEVSSLPPSSIQAGQGQVTAQASSSKMCHASHGGRQPRPILVGGEPGSRLAALLQAYTDSVHRHGRQLGAYMFSPLQADGQQLQQDKGLSTAAMSSRIVEHLQRLGLYTGESVYSVKRGSMQHAFHVQGRSLVAVGEAADIQTARVVRLYVDQSRHL